MERTKTPWLPDFIGSVRRECLDFVVILSDAHARRLIQTYVTFFNQARPHQGIDQQIPAQPFMAPLPENDYRRVVGIPILSGLHHDYRWVA